MMSLSALFIYILLQWPHKVRADFAHSATKICPPSDDIPSQEACAVVWRTRKALAIHRAELSRIEALAAHARVRVADARHALALSLQAAGDAASAFTEHMHASKDVGTFACIGNASRAEDTNAYTRLADLAVAAMEIGDVRKALDALADALVINPVAASTDGIRANVLARRMSALGARLLVEGERTAAKSLLERSIALADSSEDVTSAEDRDITETSRAMLWREFYREAFPRWHFPMLADKRRNLAYALAIPVAVKAAAATLTNVEESDAQVVRIIDVGTGSGLLAMISARAGRSIRAEFPGTAAGVAVTAVEMVPEIAAVAREVVRRNGFDDVVSVVSERSFALETPPPARKFHVLVSETLDNGLIGPSNWLGIVADARKRLLAPGAIVVPTAASVFALPVESAQLRSFFSAPSVVEGIDLSQLSLLRSGSRRGLAVAHALQATRVDQSPIASDTPSAVGTASTGQQERKSLLRTASSLRREFDDHPSVYETVRLDGAKFEPLVDSHVSIWEFNFSPDAEGSFPPSRGRRRVEFCMARAGTLDAIVVIWKARMLPEGLNDKAIPALTNWASGSTGLPGLDRLRAAPGAKDEVSSAFNHFEQPAQIFVGGRRVQKGWYTLDIFHDGDRWSFALDKVEASGSERCL
jgi:predicted RNA methylase